MNRGVVIGVGLAGVVLVAIIAFVLTRHGNAPGTTPTANTADAASSNELPPTPPDPTAPPASAVGGLAQQLCERVRANDRPGVLALMGPRWSEGVPMEELSAQCARVGSQPLADGEYGTATAMFGDEAVQRWATRSGLEPHCWGLRLPAGRIMACRNAGGEYRIAAIDFNEPVDAQVAPNPYPDDGARARPWDAFTAPPPEDVHLPN